MFDFNNLLYKYLQIIYCIKRKSRLLKLANNNTKSAIYITTRVDNKEQQLTFANVLRKSFISIFLDFLSQKSFAISTITIIKESIFIAIEVLFRLLVVTKAIAKLSFIEFSIDSSSKLDIEYKLRNYTHVKAFVFLLKYVALKKRYLNNNVDFIIFDREFFKIQALDISTRTIISTIIVRNLKNALYQFTKYVVYLVYISKIDKKDNQVCVVFCREIHLINYLKANILIENNVIYSKDIVIDF